MIRSLGVTKLKIKIKIVIYSVLSVANNAAAANIRLHNTGQVSQKKITAEIFFENKTLLLT